MVELGPNLAPNLVLEVKCSDAVIDEPWKLNGVRRFCEQNKLAEVLFDEPQ